MILTEAEGYVKQGYGALKIKVGKCISFDLQLIRAQPDLAFCGGPTESLKIRGIASSHGVNVVPHAWGTMLNLASATHFLASTYVEPGCAEVVEPLLEAPHSGTFALQRVRCGENLAAIPGVTVIAISGLKRRLACMR